MGSLVRLLSRERMDCQPIDYETLVEGLLEFFKEGKESVDIDEVIEFFNRYESRPEDWAKFAKWDKFKYTRNLMHEGNGNFNMILMCWPEGAVSAIHDHSDSHCFMRVLEGDVKEIRYYWPQHKKNPDGSLVECGQREVGAGGTFDMRTTKPVRVPMVFHSKYGEREYASK